MTDLGLLWVAWALGSVDLCESAAQRVLQVCEIGADGALHVKMVDDGELALNDFHLPPDLAGMFEWQNNDFAGPDDCERVPSDLKFG
jgi:hypothetical protein